MDDHSHHFPTELLWKIFVKSDAKTVGRCRALSRAWDMQLKSPKFVMQHWEVNNFKRCNAILGVGRNQGNSNSEWFFKYVLENITQAQLNIPILINQARYSMVGADHGVICLEINRPPHPSRLMLWNPLTNKTKCAPVKTSKHTNYDVCLYSFGFLKDSMDYRFVHVYKRNFRDTQIRWSIFHPKKISWSKSMSFNSSVSKLDPDNVVEKGVVYWIGWGGDELDDLLMVISLDMSVNKFYETNVPSEAKADHHVLTNIHGDVGFLTQTKVELGTGLMYNPTIVIGEDIFSITEAHARFGCSNASQRTGVIISKHDHDKDRPEDLMSQSWKINVAVKTMILHCDSLFLGDDIPAIE
ncbi:hypothetical protein PIB30_014820 [Stylosanthes scabra]|uniref:F-box associated beta-propeller type 1 domain-containing protein n=1 Tax=Stylosanthes scabra TaxID=79078 RepID=A0ABU6Q6X0_9FABA|nr:hypothetical protein [Stylosanthes scabra]